MQANKTLGKFKIGDKAVCSSHGVVTVQGIESLDIAGSKMDFYVLKIMASGATLKVPTQAPQNAGMRKLMSFTEIDSVKNILCSARKVSHTTWHRRFREFDEKLHTGSLDDLAEVLRDLWCLKSEKEWSFGEKTMFNKAKELLVNEICASTGKDSMSVEGEVDSWMDGMAKNLA